MDRQRRVVDLDDRNPRFRRRPRRHPLENVELGQANAGNQGRVEKPQRQHRNQR
jgi:hypothetical protein